MATLALKSFSGHFLVAEGGGGREIAATRIFPGPWERFELLELGDGKVALRAASGHLVCAEGGGDQGLIANRNWVRAWETFTRKDLQDGKIALQASNGKFVCAEGGGGRNVVANRDTANVWEQFRIVTFDGPRMQFASGLQVVVFENHSPHTAYVKDEDSTHVIEVPPGKTHVGRFDGFTVPAKMPGKVFKTQNDCDVEVRDSSFTVHCNDTVLRGKRFGIEYNVDVPAELNTVLQGIRGGWKTSPPDDGWKAIFSTSTPTPNSDPRRVHHYDERPMSDRERFEHVDRNQYEIFERQDREWVDRTA